MQLNIRSRPPTADQSVYYARTQVWKTPPFSRILDEKNTPFPTEIADFEAQWNTPFV